MLKFYFSTVLIYALIILAAAFIQQDAIRKNGWMDGAKPVSFWRGVLTLLCMAAIPLFRCIGVIVIFFMAVKRKDEVDWYPDDKEDTP